MAPARSLRNQGRADAGGWLDHARLGFNYRLDDIRAAIGVAQVEKLDTILELRAAAAARYAELLAGVDGLTVPLADDGDHVRSWFVYVVELDEGIDREHVIASLESDGVASARYLPVIHLQRTCASSTDSRGAVPRRREPRAADAGDPVPHGDRGRRAGVAAAVERALG